VQESRGAAFHPALAVPHAELVLRKGFRRAIDSYSAFRENDWRTSTGLAAYLHERGFERLTLCGLATDFCVCYSAIDLDGSLDRALRAISEASVVLGR
jgi:nicotinamidase/pyrazinamidase